MVGERGSVVMQMLVEPYVVPVACAVGVWALVVGLGALDRRSLVVVRERGVLSGAGGAIGAAVGLVVGVVLVRDTSGFWARSSIDRLPTLLGLAYLLLGWGAMGVVWARGVWRGVCVAALAGIGAAMVLVPIARGYGANRGWSWVELGVIATVVAVVGAAHAGVLMAADRGGARERGEASDGSVCAALIPAGSVGALLAMAFGVVFSWGASAIATHVATLGLMVGVLALLALPPLRIVGAARLDWLGAVVAIGAVSMGGAAAVSSVEPIPLASIVLLALAPMALLVLRVRALDPARGWRTGLAGLVVVLALGGALCGGSAWLAGAGVQADGGSGGGGDGGEVYEEWGDEWLEWTPDGDG
ncbi:MAG: hypothetical protein ACTS3F_09335 [Phycisphaerales bacterium]